MENDVLWKPESEMSFITMQAIVFMNDIGHYEEEDFSNT